MSDEHIKKLKTLQKYVNSVCSSEINSSTDWYEKVDEFSNSFMLCEKDFKSGLTKVLEFYETCVKPVEINKRQTRNALISKKERKLKDLYNEKEKLKKEYEELEQKMNSDAHQKKLKFESMAQACKILTGTDFEFGCSYTSGYMYNETTDVLKPFSLDSLNQEENEFLWSLMSNVFPIQLIVK